MSGIMLKNFLEAKQIACIRKTPAYLILYLANNFFLTKYFQLKNNFNVCFFLCLLFYLILFFLSYALPLFHDNILFSSKIPDHFFQNGLLSFPLPVKIDPGYGPIWAWYICLGWQVLGKSLWVNHLLCLPILVAAAWFYLKVTAYFLPNAYWWIAAVLLCLEPTYLTQSTMASADVFIVMGFMGGLYSIIYNKKCLLILLSILLALISVRGALLVFVIFINQLVFHYYQHKKIQIRLILPYLVPASFFIGWMLFHYHQTGYLLVRAGSPWEHHHQLAGVKTIIKNIIFSGWIFFDFGRVFLFIPTFLSLLFLLWKRKNILPKTKILLHWCLWPIVFIGIILCLRTNPIIHRYFMVGFLLIAILSVHLLANHLAKKHLNFIFTIIFAGLISGHFWMYPDAISQSWGGSLAHLPYYKLRSEMMNYLEAENINFDEVTTSFPMFNSSYYTDFTNSKKQFKVLHKHKTEESNYIIYSNVFNDFTTEDINLLKSESFVLQKNMKKRGVKMQLYMRR